MRRLLTAVLIALAVAAGLLHAAPTHQVAGGHYPPVESITIG